MFRDRLPCAECGAARIVYGIVKASIGWHAEAPSRRTPKVVLPDREKMRPRWRPSSITFRSSREGFSVLGFYHSPGIAAREMGYY